MYVDILLVHSLQYYEGSIYHESSEQSVEPVARSDQKTRMKFL